MIRLDLHVDIILLTSFPYLLGSISNPGSPAIAYSGWTESLKTATDKRHKTKEITKKSSVKVSEFFSAL